MKHVRGSSGPSISKRFSVFTCNLFNEADNVAPNRRLLDAHECLGEGEPFGSGKK